MPKYNLEPFQPTKRLLDFAPNLLTRSLDLANYASQIVGFLWWHETSWNLEEVIVNI